MLNDSVEVLLQEDWTPVEAVVVVNASDVLEACDEVVSSVVALEVLFCEEDTVDLELR